MAEVDTSMYSRLAPPPRSPLDTMSQMMDIRQKANANAQFQQEFKGRLAMGQIMQQSVDPQTGQPDYSKAAILAAQNPDAAWMSPDLMSKAVQMQGVSLDNLMKNYQNTSKRLELTGNAAASLLPMGDSVTRDDYTKAVTQLVTSAGEAGVSDKAFMDGIINSLATAPQGGPQLQQYLKQVSMQSNGAKDSMDRVQQNFQTVDSGNATHMFGYNPNTGQSIHIGSIAKSPTPQDANALVSVQNPDGSTTLKPRAQVAPMLPAGSTPGPQDSTQAPPPVGNIGQYRQDQLKAINDYHTGLNNQVGLINSNIQSIQRLQDLAKQAHTGWGANERTEAGQIAKAIGMPSGVYNGIANGSLAASQQLQKYAVPNAMNTLRESLGNQSRITNMEFGAFQRANPNLETDSDAFNKIIGFTKHLMVLKQKEQTAFKVWTDAGKDPVDFPQAWTQQLIKRGFVKGDDSYSPYDAGSK